jgi:tight adherence protein C
MHTVLVPSIVFLLVAGSLLAMGALTSGCDRLIAVRLQGLAGKQPRQNPRGPGTMGSVMAKLPQVSQRLLLPTSEKALSRLQTRFGEAGIYSPGAAPAYVAAKCMLTLILPLGFVAAGWLEWIPTWYAWLGGTAAALVGIGLPHLWLERRRVRRQFILRRALPDFLDLIVACLGGGLSVQAALKQVAEELRLAHPELSVELLAVLGEIELGRTLDGALQQLAARTGLEELRALCSFVHQTTKFGTTITDALGQLAEMLRIQREQRAEELAQKAAVKILFPTLLFIFPTVFVVLAGPAAIQIREGLKPEGTQPSSPASPK